jgi:hypothetical protein
MTRGAFVAASATSVVALQAANGTALATPAPPRTIRSNTETIQLAVNGTEHSLTLEPRVTLLDALRDRIGLTGTKKGCDQGTCGACSVLVNDRRINSCLTLAVMHEGDRITTIEGIASGDTLHPLQRAFITHDARIMNANLSDYLVPTNADIPNPEILIAEGDDEYANPAGVKGIGEVGISGSAAAVANAVYHATGVRVRELRVASLGRAIASQHPPNAVRGVTRGASKMPRAGCALFTVTTLRRSRRSCAGHPEGILRERTFEAGGIVCRCGRRCCVRVESGRA